MQKIFELVQRQIRGNIWHLPILSLSGVSFCVHQTKKIPNISLS